MKTLFIDQAMVHLVPSYSGLSIEEIAGLNATDASALAYSKRWISYVKCSVSGTRRRAVYPQRMTLCFATKKERNPILSLPRLLNILIILVIWRNLSVTKTTTTF